MSKTSGNFYIVTSMDDLHAIEKAYMRVLEFDDSHLVILDHGRLNQITAIDVSDKDLQFILSAFYRQRGGKGKPFKETWLSLVKRANRGRGFYLKPGDRLMVFRNLDQPEFLAVQTVFVKGFRKPKEKPDVEETTKSSV